MTLIATSLPQACLDKLRLWGGDRRVWITCNRFTVAVTWGADGRIKDAAPLVRKFTGQPLENLLHWAELFGGMRWEDITG
jgi:hypothetical protein